MSSPRGRGPGTGRVVAAAALAAAVQCGSTAAQAAERVASIPLLMGLGFETVHLPGQEAMGLVGGHLLFDVGRGFWVGPVTYGAATGQRGGFFVGGLELQQRWSIAPAWTLAAGLSVGGGGGAAAPVGDGLMLRPALTLQRDWGPLLAGLSASTLRFPGTAIRSSQLGLQLSWRGSFDHLPLALDGERRAADQRGGLGFDRMALTVAQHRPRDAAAGTPAFALAGARFEQLRDAQGSTWGLEAAAAAQGSAAGYMEILASASQAWTPIPGLTAGLRGAIGLGGGGNVPTGGGVLQRIDGTLALTLRPGWQLGAAWGRSHGSTPALHARRAELWLATDLEPATLPGTPGRAGTVRRTDWGLAVMHIAAVQRSDGSQRPVDTLGLVLNHWLGAHAYLSGQVYTAMAGGAGAYGAGLVGAGWSTRGGLPGWQLGAELLAGGAGGGGVSGTTGALLQTQAWASRSMGDPAQRLKLGIGAVASSAGGAARPVASISWTTGFGLVGP